MKDQKQLLMTIGIAILGAMNTSFFESAPSTLHTQSGLMSLSSTDSKPAVPAKTEVDAKKETPKDDTKVLSESQIAFNIDDKEVKVVRKANPIVRIVSPTIRIKPDGTVEEVKEIQAIEEFEITYNKRKTEGTVCADCDAKVILVPLSEPLKLGNFKAISAIMVAINNHESMLAKKAADEKAKKDQAATQARIENCEEFTAETLEKNNGSKPKAEVACIIEKMNAAKKKHTADGDKDADRFAKRLHDEIRDLTDNPKDKESLALSKEIYREFRKQSPETAETIENFWKLNDIAIANAKIDKDIATLGQYTDDLARMERDCHNYYCLQQINQGREYLRWMSESIHDKMRGYEIDGYGRRGAYNAKLDPNPIQFRNSLYSDNFRGGLYAAEVLQAFEDYRDLDARVSNTSRLPSILTREDDQFYNFLAGTEDPRGGSPRDRIGRGGNSTTVAGRGGRVYDRSILATGGMPLTQSPATMLTPTGRYSGGGYSGGAYNGGYPNYQNQGGYQGNYGRPTGPYANNGFQQQGPYNQNNNMNRGGYGTRSY